ncbi:MAG TPA: glycoside hydrolase family 2 TIM barrel-domain containing protein [Verrucomicrobiae bacterium]|nr:glycoside hydrolase family 2 TIM barrel-domain containing protein [Verrucomicrobiae bacterium]
MWLSLVPGLGIFLAGSGSMYAATTNFNWIATSPADYSVAGDWDQGTVPGGSGPGFNYAALFTNNVACNYYSNSSAVLDNDWAGQMSLGAWNNSTGTFVMNGGTLLVSNAPNVYAVTIGGRDGAAGAGGASLSPSSGANSVGNFTMNGGTLTVSRADTAYYKDSFFVGLGTNSTGTLTLNGGVANFLCGVELGVYGAGTINVTGGAIVDDGWFGVGRGNGVPMGSGTFNLTGGAVYILPNFAGGTTGANGGIFLNQGCTNATINLSGGSVYVVGIGFNGSSYASLPQDNLNISGGSLYLGFNGIYTTSSSEKTSVNISGGTFHTLDMIGVGNGGVAGSTNADLLADGTNWTWTAPSVNLTNSSFLVNGVSGPGYVAFAPEPGRTITLDNAWNGVGGLTVNGPGTLAIISSNSYTGNTVIAQGTLAIFGGSIGGSPYIIVASGAALAGATGGAGYTPAYTLAAGNTLTNSGSMALLEGDIDTGPGTVALSYASGTPAFTVTGGVLGLSSSTVFEVNNTGPVLASGSYQIISAGAGGSISLPGGLPAVTVTGNGIAAGENAYLTVSNNSLCLEITTSRPPQIANVVTNTLYYGATWQIAITNLEALAGWSDPNGQPIGLSSVGPFSANGTNVTTDGTNIYYNGTLTSDDYFTYSITDATLTAVGAVQLITILPTAAIPADIGDSMSLDGSWRFYFEHTNYNFGTPPNVVLPPPTQPTFQQLNYVETPGWTNLPVPGNWEMYGISPCTYYVNDNTCGLYRYWIQIPQSWQGRRVYIYFDGVQNGAEIWLNGQPVPVNESSWNINNYHESGWTGFQVDLTSQANFGTTNLLAVRVIKNTPSNDLDTGDYFMLGGIDRPVTLYSVPQTNIADVQVSTYVTNDVGTVDVLADINGGNATTPVSMLLNGVETDTTATNGTAIFSQVINQAKLWSAEFPNLYTLTVQLKATNGLVTETVTNRIGIRQLTITNGVLLLNGVPVKFAGVGDHDSTPTNGSAIPPGFWYNELKMMKAANINAVRTCHYPYDSALYDAADEAGIYVSDELPYCWCSPETSEANFEAAFVQRAQETIRRDRNHPSVVIWAIGNENSAGNNLQVVANVVHSLDPTRPRLVSTFNASQYGTELSDAHYPSLGAMQSDAANAAATGHPFIFLENPNTWDERLGADAGMWEDWGLCMQRVWNICIASNTIPGTFPFEWSDRAVQDPNSAASYTNDGAQQLYYFPATNVRLLKMKGMVDAFRNPRPNLYELQMIYSPVQISNSLTVSSGQVSFPIQNRYSFTDLSYLTTQWQLERNGMTIASGNTNIEMPPLNNGSAQLSLPAAALAYADTLRLDFIHPDGDDIYAYQFALSNTPPVSMITTNLPAGLPIPQFNLVTQTNYSDPVYWEESIRFPATLTSVTLVPANATTLAQLNSLSATVMGGVNGVQVLGTIQAGYTNNVFSYTLHWTGPSWPVQEVGWTFQMPAACTNFSWNRNGRWAVYPDSDIGRASGMATPGTTNVDVTEMDIPDAFDFNSTKYNCNWASLTSASGDGLRLQFSSQQLFDCRAGGNASGYLLYANQQVSPANDISANIVPDLFMTLSSGNVLQDSFTVGSNSNLVSAAAGSLNGPINVLVSPTGGLNGHQVELNFNANASSGYSVWASTNLVTWQWDGTATQGGSGQYEFFDQLATNSPCRFYRITSP